MILIYQGQIIDSRHNVTKAILVEANTSRSNQLHANSLPCKFSISHLLEMRAKKKYVTKDPLEVPHLMQLPTDPSTATINTSQMKEWLGELPNFFKYGWFVLPILLFLQTIVLIVCPFDSITRLCIIISHSMSQMWGDTPSTSLMSPIVGFVVAKII